MRTIESVLFETSVSDSIGAKAHQSSRLPSRFRSQPQAIESHSVLIVRKRQLCPPAATDNASMPPTDA
ncbi:hypothetical protein A0H81_13016 [Grifola frondosa]|uniref:Uncharacterized protein n=1 Tax=Grifola frondosa TaxID=5627 RepID=A0A1C7LQL3_GRIFR|nr:hypothetical protein A0H81_13016 [Grifola frondosa]